MCVTLSKWWTGGKRDDVFWRSSNSGGRATVRWQSGKKTFGHAGDIAAVDPIGQPLLKCVTIELKRGYRKTTFADVFDRCYRHKATEFEQFIMQAERAAQHAGTPHWLLITRRDKREALVFLSIHLDHYLREKGHHLQADCDLYLRMRVIVRWPEGPRTRQTVCAVQLSEFLKAVSPDAFRM